MQVGGNVPIRRVHPACPPYSDVLPRLAHEPLKFVSHSCLGVWEDGCLNKLGSCNVAVRGIVGLHIVCKLNILRPCNLSSHWQQLTTLDPNPTCYSIEAVHEVACHAKCIIMAQSRTIPTRYSGHLISKQRGSWSCGFVASQSIGSRPGQLAASAIASVYSRTCRFKGISSLPHNR